MVLWRMTFQIETDGFDQIVSQDFNVVGTEDITSCVRFMTEHLLQHGTVDIELNPTSALSIGAMNLPIGASHVTRKIKSAVTSLVERIARVDHIDLDTLRQTGDVVFPETSAA